MTTGRCCFRGSVEPGEDARAHLAEGSSGFAPAQIFSAEIFGGAGRDRTADKGFADLCLTTWRPRLGLTAILPDTGPPQSFFLRRAGSP